MTKLTKDNLEGLIRERIEIFKNADEAVSKYNAEQETIKEYNGRQILELIQNADDAGAKTISIKLNTGNKELVFFNDGVAFDYEGIKSIMIANLSSKLTTSSYIGNKGLGFRSILNWADSVSIYSAGLEIDFSLEVLKRYLDKELSDLKSKLHEIRQKRNLSSACIPLPILGLPSVGEKSYGGCDAKNGCALVIHYNKDKEEDIINQIKAIDDRTLLFLLHIQKVTLSGLPDMGGGMLSIVKNIKDWYVDFIDEELDEKYQDKNKREKKKYTVKIAVPNTNNGLLNEETHLYNYLPTKEQVHLPFLMHATVELDSSRNHIINTPVNDFILEKAAELICKIAQKHLVETQGHPDWIAYHMMTPAVLEKEYGSLKKLYYKLDELKKDMKIYPTVDNQYATAKEYYYYNNAVSDFWVGFGKTEGDVSKMLKPVDGGFEIARKLLPDFVNAINEVSKSIGDSIANRVSLIRHIYDHKNVLFIDQSKLQVLIDNKGKVIEGEAYVQDSGNKELAQNRPQWVTYDIVDSDLAKALIDEFHDEIQTAKQLKRQEGQESYSDVRCLVGLLDFANIHYFDITGAATKVVKQANELLLDANVSGKPTLIGEMLDYLYDLRSDAKLERVRLLDANGNVCKAEDLLLPTKLNKEIFDGIKDVQYILEIEAWKKRGYLSKATEDSFEEFMQKLGVNRWLEEVPFTNVFQGEYCTCLGLREVFSDSLGQTLNDINKGSKEIKIFKLREGIMEILKQLSLQKALRFISEYTEVQVRLKESLILKSYYNGHWRKVPTSFNYVRYQLSTLPCVKWKVYGTNLILDDTDDVVKLAPDVKRIADDAIELIRTDFQYEGVNEIQQFLRHYSNNIRDGKKAQILYKLIVDGWGERRTGMENVELYSSDADGKKGFHPSNKVFYTSNTCLPKKVIEKLGLYRLDYATRQAANNITNIFGLYRIDDLDFKIVDPQDSDSSQEFDAFFRQLRPYFLLYAIQNASKDSSKATIAGYIKKCNIHLVSKCVYSIKGEEPVDLGEGEFINVENDYYLKVPVGFSLAEMKASTTYCDAVMEILGMAFKLETKNEHFLHVFQSFDFMKRYIDETRKDEIEECYKLLGISLDETNFWRKYGELKELELDFDATDFYVINGSIIEFGRDDVKNVDFSSWNNKESIDFLKIILTRLASDDQRKSLLEIVDLSAWHKYRFDSVRTEFTRAFVHKLWTLLNDQYQDKRPKYFTLQDAYSQLNYEKGWEHELKEDEYYLAALNKKVTKLFHDNGITAEGDLNESSPKDEPLNLYKKQIPSIQEEKDMEGDRWRLYFNGNDAFISNYLDMLKNEDAPTDADTTNNTEEVKGRFVEWGVGSKAHCPSPGKGKSKGSSVHTTKADRNKAKAGKEAEERVDSFLRNQEIEGVCKYGEWVSKRDDSLGYDFTYTMDGQERLLEVKYSSDNTFSLTGNEYAVAMINTDRYDIAIVDGDGKVTIYKSFFKGFPNISPKDYLVSFAVKNEGKNDDQL